MSKTMQVRFVGPEPSRSVPQLEGDDLVFPAGVTVTVPEALGRSLTEQQVFEQVKRRAQTTNVER